MKFEGVVVELQRHDLVGKFHSCLGEVHSLDNVLPDIVGVLGIRTCMEQNLHWKSMKNSMCNLGWVSPRLKPYPFLKIGTSWSQLTTNKIARRHRNLISRLLLQLVRHIRIITPFFTPPSAYIQIGEFYMGERGCPKAGNGWDEFLLNSRQFKLMKKQKKTEPTQLQTHSRNPSLQRQRNSHPRLTLHPSPPPPARTTTAHFLSNPSSLEKKKPKAVRKKAPKPKKKIEQMTRETIESTGEDRWKEHLKLTFRSTLNKHELSLHNSSLKCMEEICEGSLRKPGESYSSLVGTFPRQEKGLTVLEEKERVLLVDWLSFVAAQILLRRNTLHLAVVIIDAYLDAKGSAPAKLQALGAGALLLAVKQEERGNQTEVLGQLSGNGSGLNREEIIKVESSVVLGLNFKLNLNTLPFWCDYFSQKWDHYVEREQQRDNPQLGELKDHLVLLRDPQGLSYKYYRQTMQLLDTFLMHSSHRRFDFPKLTLAVIYIVVRIQSESQASSRQSEQIFSEYYQGFKKKASPIFKDRWVFNAIFNEFITEVCDFEITELIPAIRWCGQFLNINFSYDIDARVYESAQNYEQFLRFTNYSEHVRSYFIPNDL